MFVGCRRKVSRRDQEPRARSNGVGLRYFTLSDPPQTKAPFSSLSARGFGRERARSAGVTLGFRRVTRFDFSGGYLHRSILWVHRSFDCRKTPNAYYFESQRSPEVHSSWSTPLCSPPRQEKEVHWTSSNRVSMWPGSGQTPANTRVCSHIRGLLETFIDPSMTLRERETKTKETWKGHQEKSTTESAEVVSECAIPFNDYPYFSSVSPSLSTSTISRT